MNLNPFRLLCFIGCHSYIHVKATQYIPSVGWAITHWVKECSVCDKRVVYIESRKYNDEADD